MTTLTAEHTASTPLSDEHWDVIIIGGGTAGLSAALILSRARRRVLVLDAQQPRNRFAPHMHGVLSRDGYSPLDLVADGYREVRAVDGVIHNARAVHARLVDAGFEVSTETGERITGRRLIFASGLRDELPDIAGLAEQWGLGVVACPYCDGYEASGRAIAVLAGSVAGAVHKAHMLRSYSSDITVFTALCGPLPEDDRRVLAQRGIRIDDRPVTRVLTEGDTLTGLALADGTTLAMDVVFTEPRMHALDEPLQQLGVNRIDTPAGSLPEVDAFGRTSITGVWAVGNAVNPGALVPIAAAEGAIAALALNGELVQEEIDAAAADAAAEFWEQRYLSRRGDEGRMWSGQVNAAVAREVADLSPGTALDLGCGEGADALWLAGRGWNVTAVDISANALAVASARAAEEGLAGRIHWLRADLATWQPAGTFDLITAAFLHSPVMFPRAEVLRRAALAVAPGGRLLIVGHGAFPSQMTHADRSHDAAPLPGADEVLASLHLPTGWTVETMAAVDREITGPEGQPLTIVDTVLRVRREK